MPKREEFLRYRVVERPRGKFPHIRYAETMEEAKAFYKLGRGIPRMIEGSTVRGGSDAPWTVVKRSTRWSE